MRPLPLRFRSTPDPECADFALGKRMDGAATEPKTRTSRQAWMAVLARATAAELEAIFDHRGGLPPHTILKPAEVGTLMLEARAGGSGQRFNAGEATLTRCVVRLVPGRLGYSYSLGIDRRKALLAAVLDGLLQCPQTGRDLEQTVIAPLAEKQRQAREIASRKAAATKVDFFTLARGNE